MQPLKKLPIEIFLFFLEQKINKHTKHTPILTHNTLTHDTHIQSHIHILIQTYMTTYSYEYRICEDV